MKITLSSRSGLAVIALIAVAAIAAVIVVLNRGDDTEPPTSVGDQTTEQPEPSITVDDDEILADDGLRADVDIAVLVAMTVADAEAWAQARGMTIRTVRLDGEDLAVTMDFRQDRINVEVKGGVVSAVQGVG